MVLRHTMFEFLFIPHPIHVTIFLSPYTPKYSVIVFTSLLLENQFCISCCRNVSKRFRNLKRKILHMCPKRSPFSNIYIQLEPDPKIQQMLADIPLSTTESTIVFQSEPVILNLMHQQCSVHMYSLPGLLVHTLLDSPKATDVHGESKPLYYSCWFSTESYFVTATKI